MTKILDVYSDLSEKLNYNLPDFPLYVRRGALRQFDRFAAECHWHLDLEFLLVLEGSLDYFVNGRIVQVDAGRAIFVNSKRLHYGFSETKRDSTYIVVVIHPALLGEGTHRGRAYWQEKFGASTADYMVLASESPWQCDAIALMSRLYDEMHSTAPNPLRLLSQAATLCAAVGDHIQQGAGDRVDGPAWMTVRAMTGYIHRHYDDRITLADIAAAGAVSRSKCCKLFGRYVGQTPNQYLTRYRIQKGCEMLRETQRSIGEIAGTCGFRTGSYFAYSFRREMGVIPLDYRRQCQG